MDKIHLPEDTRSEEQKRIDDTSPMGFHICGPSFPTCVCKCPESCGHSWDGPVKMDGNMGTCTCSRCGMTAIDHDMWVLS